VPGSGHIENVQVSLTDGAVEMDVEEIETWCCPEMAEQSGLHLLGGERLAKQWVVEQVDLTDREIVGSSPIGVEKVDFRRTQRVGLGGCGAGRGHGQWNAIPFRPAREERTAAGTICSSTVPIFATRKARDLRGIWWREPWPALRQ
jgi:hypothetical protein